MRASEAEPAVLHVDIDAFFAAIEQQRDPRLAGRPVIVGAGVIASCSYQARAFGLRAGMPLSEARRLCPEAVILEGHAQVYRCFAEQIFACCREVSPAVETYLDEAYCDLGGTERLHGDLVEAARGLKRAIRAATGLAVTCGIGPNRMLAKLIGKTVKPDGLARIGVAGADAFMRDHGSDYFENSRQATFVQQAYAMHNPQQFIGYGEHCWGFTACDGPGWVKRAVGGVER